MVQGKLVKTKPGKFEFMTLGTNTDIKPNLFLDGNIITLHLRCLWSSGYTSGFTRKEKSKKRERKLKCV